MEGAGLGVNINCAACANTAYLRLTGADLEATAANFGRYGNMNDLLPSAPMGFGEFGSVESATQEMLARGDGAVSSVLLRQQGDYMHAITSLNRNGEVFFIDTQSGHIVTIQPHVPVSLARPWP